MDRPGCPLRIWPSRKRWLPGSESETGSRLSATRPTHRTSIDVSSCTRSCLFTDISGLPVVACSQVRLGRQAGRDRSSARDAGREDRAEHSGWRVVHLRFVRRALCGANLFQMLIIGDPTEQWNATLKRPGGAEPLLVVVKQFTEAWNDEYLLERDSAALLMAKPGMDSYNSATSKSGLFHAVLVVVPGIVVCCQCRGCCVVFQLRVQRLEAVAGAGAVGLHSGGGARGGQQRAGAQQAAERHLPNEVATHNRNQALTLTVACLMPPVRVAVSPGFCWTLRAPWRSWRLPRPAFSGSRRTAARRSTPRSCTCTATSRP